MDNSGSNECLSIEDLISNSFCKMENEHASEEQVEWEQIQSPFSAVTAQLISDSDNSVAVKDDFYGESSAFPPENHEDLPIDAPQNDNQHMQEPEPVNLPPSPVHSNDSRSWKGMHFGVIQAGFFRIADRVRKSVTCKVGYWSVALAAGGVAAVLLVSFMHRRVLIWRQRCMQLESSKNSFLFIVKEKDEKINELLLQIAQMNEALQARRRVPVIRSR